MSFKLNTQNPNSRQVSFFDPQFSLSNKKYEILKESWAPVFYEEIFCRIDEEPFRALFDEEGAASRPNSPINVIVGANILQNMFGMGFDDAYDSILFDIRFSYALGLASVDNLPSKKTFKRLMDRMSAYYDSTGIDLVHEVMESLSESISKIMDIDRTKRRMDSFMVSMSAKDMGRRELLYNAIAGFVKYAFFIDDIRENAYMEHYTQDNDRNTVLYHSGATKEKLDCVLFKDADLICEKYGNDYSGEKAYQTFSRIVDEQTVVEDGNRRWRTKEDGGFNSNMAQSISDQDATFRSKAGENHKGYVANVEESVGKNSTLITGYQFEKNNTADSKMLEDHLHGMGRQEKPTIIVADGAFQSQKASELAKEKNVEIVNTALLGKDVDPVFGEFKMSDDGQSVETCPHGETPISCTYNEKTGQCSASFEASCCEGCPYHDTCKPTGKKDTRTVRVSAAKVARALKQAEMGTEEYKEYGRFRNGVETIPSFFRRVLGVDFMESYTYTRNRLKFGFKVMAFNALKLLRFKDCRWVKCA